MIRQLAYEWVKVELPSGRLPYADYIESISGLNPITEDPDRTVAIFTAIISQAKRLGYDLEWVQAELKFEAQVEAVGDRSRWLRLDVAANNASDSSLDLYNQRIHRFD